LKRRNTTAFANKNSFYHKIVKAAIKSDRFTWLKSIDKNVKSQLEQIWKCAASFRIVNSASIQLAGDDKRLVESRGVADELSRHFSQDITIFVLMTSPPFHHLLNC
jgi:hypothetical protein